jgi:hypothetical protein
MMRDEFVRIFSTPLPVLCAYIVQTSIYLERNIIFYRVREPAIKIHKTQ